MAVPFATLAALDEAEFVAALEGVWEHSPWIAARASAGSPYADVTALHAAMVAVVEQAGIEAQLGLIRAHPELAGKAAIRGELTAESRSEQGGVGLDQCSAEEFAQITDLNARYGAKFGHPFIIAVRGHTRASIIASFAQRLENDATTERAECLRQIARIALLRLQDRFEDQGDGAG